MLQPGHVSDWTTGHVTGVRFAEFGGDFRYVVKAGSRDGHSFNLLVKQHTEELNDGVQTSTPPYTFFDLQLFNKKS